VKSREGKRPRFLDTWSFVSLSSCRAVEVAEPEYMDGPQLGSGCSGALLISWRTTRQSPGWRLPALSATGAWRLVFFASFAANPRVAAGRPWRIHRVE
jgi:hypothetical protein